MKKQRIIVAMSGGVDSSVAALLLKQQGHQVYGLLMNNWQESQAQESCSSAQDFADMAKVCQQLDIEYRQVNFAKEYWQEVFRHFLNDYQQGLTPNPDVLCNREIKFKTLLSHALDWGADYLATGHHCQIDHSLPFPRLAKAVDPNKDQSYFLQSVTEKALGKTLFPIGHLQKQQVRQIAQKFSLPTHDKKDSTGLCFIGERPFREFLSNYLHDQPGPIKTLAGEVVGTHRNTAFYTIGQRKGMGLGGPGKPWFVVDKNAATHTLIVARGEDHPALYSQRLWACDMSWINPHDQSKFLVGTTHLLQTKIRYRQDDQNCKLTILGDGKIEVWFPTAQRAVSPGQYIAFYQGSICLGGARITQRSKERGSKLEEGPLLEKSTPISQSL